MSGKVLTDERRKARKDHLCGLCGRDIKAGTMYRYHTFAIDGSVWSHHEHEQCVILFYGEWWDGDPYDLPDQQEFQAALDSPTPSSGSGEGGR